MIFRPIPHHYICFMQTQSFFQKLLQSMDNGSIRKTVGKGEFLIREGDIENNLYYIESGAVRAFMLSEFEELTIRFGYQGSFINSLSSYIKGTPSEFYIEAMRKSEIRIIPKQEIVKLIHESEENKIQYSNMLEHLISQQIEREIDLLTVSPSERLKRVLKRSPNLFQEVPLKYIASYLRMTPETLSRVRNS